MNTIRTYLFSLLIAVLAGGIAFWFQAAPEFLAKQNDGDNSGPCACDLLGAQLANSFFFRCWTRVETSAVNPERASIPKRIDWARTPEILAKYRRSAVISLLVSIITFLVSALSLNAKTRQ